LLLILRLAPSPTTEALAVISSLKLYLAQPHQNSHQRLLSADQSSINLSTDSHGRDGISLKLALFNLQKYIKEEDFVIDFMLKGGVKMLVRLMEGDSGLSGNSLAVRAKRTNSILDEAKTLVRFARHPRSARVRSRLDRYRRGAH
jgi:engulfment/cell motility protein 1